jgi:hypothetical protein
MQLIPEYDGQVWKVVEGVIRELIGLGYLEREVRDNKLVVKGIMYGVVRGFLACEFEEQKGRTIQ